MTKKHTVVWLRQDLRVEDHPALSAACERGNVVPVFIWEQHEEGEWPMGAASRWWLHHSLESLSKDLSRLGMQLVIRCGPAADVLEQLLAETGADAVFWSRRYEPASLERDTAVKSILQSKGIEAQSFNAALLYEPWTVANKQGKPFQVFTPFWKSCLAMREPEAPKTTPNASSAKSPHIPSLPLDALQLLPTIHWDAGINAMWTPGSRAAKKRLASFLKHAVLEYGTERDFPNVDGVSLMSPYLHFGEISPRMIWQAVKSSSGGDPRVEVFLRQLGWREFAHHLLYHFPQTPLAPLRPDYTAFPWINNTTYLHAWQKGLTGYPFVDAGMRQLWKTGWMHNRVRMVVGSFLVKDLLITWTEGARWFWDTLVDADLANNTLGWQWVGGCGADAAPYFRVFNPITQGEKFDPDGGYVRRWVPELAALPAEWIHRPWEAPELILRQAGVVLGKSYPYPIVDHAKARLLALEAFAKIR